MSAQKYALLSVYDKEGIDEFARGLISQGYGIISSGGTHKYLVERGIEVTDLAELTGYPPVLRHRVVTLAPQIHGGLLATEEMYPELDELGWKKIHLLAVDFYPLHKALEEPDATFESCLEKTDIGGPAMIRSANKGGETIVLVSLGQRVPVLEWIAVGEPDREKVMFGLRQRAEHLVANYSRLSAEVYSTFRHKLYPGVIGPDWIKY
jgi:phosphoribosylaminoimidazolecarboxamide formyltransferase/IMP cyclohydrolase